MQKSKQKKLTEQYGNETGVERNRKKDKRKTSTRTLQSKRDQDTVEGRFTVRLI